MKRKVANALASIREAKAKAYEFMELYEKRNSERQIQKHKLKQSIMKQIASSRKNYHHSDPYPYLNQNQYSQCSSRQISEVVSPDSRIRDSRSQGRNFYKKPPNNQEQKAYSMTHNFDNDYEMMKYEELANSKEDYINGKAKLPKGRDTNTLIKREEFIKSLKSKQGKQIHQEGIQQQRLQNQNTFREDIIQISSPIANKDTERISSRLKKQNHVLPIESSVRESQNQNQQSAQIKESIQNISIDPKERGLFVSVAQDESMDMTEDHRNLAFDIMEKSNPTENMQILKRKKIEQLERKRQVRKQASQKKIESQKKSDNSLNRGKSTNMKKTETKVTNDPESIPTPPLHRLKPKVPNRNRLLSTGQQINYESQYNFRQTNKNKKSNDKKNAEQNSYRPGSSYRETPKTVRSENKLTKSRNSNIFKQSPSRHDKSANKYSQQPKIQPKERKNTFVKQSNKKLMTNAISNACLPGELNRKERQKLLEVLENNASQFFVFLFKEYSRKVIKAIYVLDPTQTTLEKIYGEKAPQELNAGQITSFYRFDSGSREFKKLDGCKSFSFVVHAIDVR